jgi:5-methylcytosine-specific restriction protein A
MAKDRDYIKMINSSRWRRLRARILTEHPLCERCLEDNIYTAAQEVHHRTPVETVAGWYNKERLMFNPDNLQALCHRCHVQTHMELGRGTREQSIERTKKEIEHAKRLFD